MPKKIPKICNAQGCPKLTFESYCEKHKDLSGGKFRNKKGKVHPWYNHRIWKGNPNKPLGERGGLREAQLKREPLCYVCAEEGSYNQATVVDHDTEWKTGKTEEERWRLFIDHENHRSMCQSHHNAKTARNNRR